MRKTLILICAAMIWSISGIAQVDESDKTMSLGIYNALSIELEDAKEKMVKKMWKEYMKDYGDKTKKVKKEDELLTAESTIYDIAGSDKMNVYARTNDMDNSTLLSVWFDLGDDFLNSSNHKKQYKEAEKFLMKFALNVKIALVEMELEDEEDLLKDKNKDLEKLEKNYGKYVKEIEKCEETIKKMESNKEQNQIDQEKTKEAITAQQDNVQKVKDKLKALRE